MNDNVVLVNGEFYPTAKASISVFDRGFLFADAVYEVVSLINGKLVDTQRHMQRLENSLDALDIQMPATREVLVDFIKELVKRNGLEEGLVYLQVSRGSAPRSFEYPKDITPTLVMFTSYKDIQNDPLAKRGIRIVTLEDVRWKHRHIKTVGLLGASMSKQAAVDAGVDDAWLVEDGFVTEGTSSNAFIVSEQNVLITRHLGNQLLPGITRRAVIELINKEQMLLEERPFTVQEAMQAKEAFITSASSLVTPVIEIDGQPIGTGQPGEVAQKLRDNYLAFFAS